MRRTIITALTLTAMTTFIPRGASAGGLFTRCSEDLLTISQGKGRNAWAAKCGYIDAGEQAFYDAKYLYLVFTTGSWTGKPAPVIPISAAKPCIKGLVPLGLCGAHCYPPNQELEFDGEPVSVERAHATRVPTVTALTAESTLDALVFDEQAIEEFTAVEVEEEIYGLHGDGEQRLEVTAGHPMVRVDGTFATPEQLVVGDALMGASGEPIVLVEITRTPFRGRVWNLQPESADRRENILVAEGFLTGSLRFLREWAGDVYRLTRRDRIALPGGRH